MDKPKQKEFIDWTNLLILAEDHLNTCELDNDNKHYIYEEVMTAIYGDEVWGYINNNSKGE
jgi:hypothetical protein